MKKIGLISFFCVAAFVNASITGKVVDQQGNSIQDAVVSIKEFPKVLPQAMNLSDSEGKFVFGDENLPIISKPIHGNLNLWQGQPFELEIADLRGKILKRHLFENSNYAKANEVAKNLIAELPKGLYVAIVKQNGKRSLLGKINALANRSTQTEIPVLRKMAENETFLVVRKAGFLPETLSVTNPTDCGEIVLRQDPIESEIDQLMANMSTDEMIAQMTQTMVPTTDCGGYTCGSALQGGGEYSSSFYKSAWSPKIPVFYGKDNVHGMGDVTNATIFPHNIGLGATRDSALVRRIGQAVAEEMWAAHIDLNFSPAISVPRDERWGRTYEGFGEIPELVASLGAAYVRGLQGDNFDAEWRVPATVKHFLGDGATDKGYDRGNATISEEELNAIHLPPYIAAIEQGVQSVMASFNQVNGVHQHVDSLRLTVLLKKELGFDGYVIADWEGIENSKRPGEAGNYSGSHTGVSSTEAVRNAINAGIDMAMVPQSASTFISSMKSLVSSGQISQERLKDAVRRILRVKIRAGRLDNPNGPSKYVGVTANIGSESHREIAREAVQKSLVVLKNNEVLPLSKTGKYFLTGSHANNAGYQCGGWTQGWTGKSGSISGATTIQGGFDQVASGVRVYSANESDAVVYVIGEVPYAEWLGDFRSGDFNDKFITSAAYEGPQFGSTSQYLTQINSWKSEGKKVAVVLITGRPLPITSLIEASDAFVVAWLPGSEGAGVADVLFGDVKPTGKLPHTWPKDASQIPINYNDGKEGLFPYGYGLTY